MPAYGPLVEAETTQPRIMHEFDHIQLGRTNRHMSDPSANRYQPNNSIRFYSAHEATAEVDMYARSRRGVISNALCASFQRLSKHVRRRMLHSMALFHDDVCGVNFVTVHSILNPPKGDGGQYKSRLKYQPYTESTSRYSQQRRRMYLLDEPTTRQVAAGTFSNQPRVNQDGTPRSFSSPVRNHTRVNALPTLERTSDRVYRVERNTNFMSVTPRDLVRCRSCDSDEHFHQSNDSGASIGADRPSRGWHVKRVTQGPPSEYSQDVKTDQNITSVVSPKQSDTERNVPYVGHSSATTPLEVSPSSGKDGIHDKSSYDRSDHHNGLVQRRRKLGVVPTDFDGEWIISRQQYESDTLGKAIQNSCLGVLQRHRRSCAVHSEQDSVDEETSSLTNRSQSQESSKLYNSSGKLPTPLTDSGTRKANLFAKLCSTTGVVKSSEQLESRCKGDESPGST